MNSTAHNTKEVIQACSIGLDQELSVFGNIADIDHNSHVHTLADHISHFKPNPTPLTIFIQYKPVARQLFVE